MGSRLSRLYGSKESSLLTSMAATGTGIILPYSICTGRVEGPTGTGPGPTQVPNRRSSLSLEPSLLESSGVSAVTVIQG
jgi:hypothetical protein